MAKAKGSKSSTEEAKPAAEKKKAATKKAPELKKHAAIAGAPMIDTNLAAAAAARMLVAGFNKPAGNVQTGSKNESAMFKQMKAGMNKPSSTTISNMLEKSHGPEPIRSHQQMKQIGHNQTHNADVTRSGVPRRTPG